MMCASAPHKSSVLVISATLGYRHDSIGPAIAQLQGNARAQEAYNFTFTEEVDEWFGDAEKLAAFDALMFLSTTGDVFDELQLGTFAAYAASPEKAVLGVHAAVLTNSESAVVRAVFGTGFHYHPQLQEATVYKLSATAAANATATQTRTREHPCIRNFPKTITLEDEWYNFDADPSEAPRCTLLLAVDESSYEDDGERLVLYPHPVAWCREAGGSGDGDGDDAPRCRVWYTSLGHSCEIWRNDVFVGHVLDGLRWATRR